MDYLEVYPGGGINIYLKLTGEGGYKWNIMAGTLDSTSNY